MEKIVFWPELASVHYAKDRLEELNIEYVPKEENPQTNPQLRSIKNVWANIKREIYSNSYRPKDVRCLMAKIRKELKFIETRKAMKEEPAKARKSHRLEVMHV
jgi:hypothetical protein